MKVMPTKALLDTNILPSTVTHHLKIVRQTNEYGDRLLTQDVETAVRRRLRNKTEEESDTIYKSLEQIAGLAKSGGVTLYDSDETFFESLYVRLPPLRGTPFDMFLGVARKFVRGPLGRTYAIGGDYSKERANQLWLQTLAKIQHPRFLQFKKRTNGSHLADLYHVWTAEQNSLDCFLTLDTTFLNAVTLPKPMDTPVRLFTPMQFVQWITATPIHA